MVKYSWAWYRKSTWLWFFSASIIISYTFPRSLYFFSDISLLYPPTFRLAWDNPVMYFRGKISLDYLTQVWKFMQISKEESKKSCTLGAFGILNQFVSFKEMKSNERTGRKLLDVTLWFTNPIALALIFLSWSSCMYFWIE